MDTKGGTAGGGEVLDYIGNKDDFPSYMNDNLIQQFNMLPWAKVAIVCLLVVAAILLIVSIFKIRSPFKGRTVTKELEHLTKVKKRDEQILKANRMIKGLTALIEHSPFKMADLNKDYWMYNLKRANIRVPGGSRVMKPEEFNALVTIVELAFCAIGIAVGLLLNFMLGGIIVIASIVIAGTFPMMVIRQSVKAKDLEITENFADFYLMIHYVLLASANTPLEGIMKSYDKTTNSAEMHRFIDSCIHHIDTYGEYEATGRISREYREIPEVGKLMRLIKQSSEGGDVRMELMGFREELLNAKKYAIEMRMNKMVAKAKASFNILMPILFQAIISAMAIYMDDMGDMSSIFGGL